MIIIQKEFGGVRSQGQEYVRTFRGKGFRKEMDKGFKEEKRETKGIISLIQSQSPLGMIFKIYFKSFHIIASTPLCFHYSLQEY